MKPIIKQFNKKAAFTIIELLTVMSIIVILIGLLVPSLSMVKRYAKNVKQGAQFHSIDVAMELFQTEFDGYPNSEYETTPDGYCGAMKLTEAMVGMDLLGFHPDSLFRSDGMNLNLSPPDDDLYPPNPTKENLKARRGPYLQLENVNAYRLKNLYGVGKTGAFDEDLFVLCDVYTRVTNKDTGKKVGMPVLYYKADISGTKHDPNVPDDPDNIYNYKDNDKLVELGMPWEPPASNDHELYASPEKFYEKTKNDKIDIPAGRPYRSDSYILLSAGFDGEYGTPDDVFNFED